MCSVFLSYILNKELDKSLWDYYSIIMLLPMFSYAQHLKVLEKPIIFIIAYMGLEAGGNMSQPVLGVAVCLKLFKFQT
jgi:hypothetical protein